jgi:CBS domain-containing protein
MVSERGTRAGLVTDKSAIVSVDINTPTLKALSLLVRGGRSAVAVLSPDRRLITNLSTSDLRYAAKSIIHLPEYSQRKAK